MYISAIFKLKQDQKQNKLTHLTVCRNTELFKIKWVIYILFFFVVEKHLSSFKLLMQDVDNETPYIFVSEYL